MYKVSIAYNPHYITSLNSIDNNNAHQTAKWLNDIIKSSGKPVKSATPIDDALNTFDNFFASKSHNPKTVSNWRTAFKDLAQVVLGFFYANVWLDYVLTKKPNIKLLDLLAACAIFASDNVVKDVISGVRGSNNPGNAFASWDNCLRVRNTYVKSGTPLTLCKYNSLSDNNTYANRFIKTAILGSFGTKFSGYGHRCFADYEACHIWGNPTCPQYFSSIPNLVLLPRAIGGITDHFKPAQELFQYHSVQLFGLVHTCTINPLCANNITKPTRPKNYSSIKWRSII